MGQKQETRVLLVEDNPGDARLVLEYLRQAPPACGVVVDPVPCLTDATARLGGDEFALLVEGLGSSCQAETVAEKIRAALREVAPAPLRPGPVGVSIGIARFPEDADTPDGLLSCADQRMYQSKPDRAGLMAAAKGPGPAQVAAWPESAPEPAATPDETEDRGAPAG